MLTEAMPPRSGALSPEDRIEALIALTNELSGLMREETALLNDQRPSAIAPLQERKAKLAAAYAVAIREVAADRSSLADASVGLLQDLKDITRRFERQAQEQQAILNGAASAVEGVVRAVAEEARPKSSSYGPSSGAAAQSAAPVAIDERG